MTTTWKEKLSGKIEEGLAREIDIFETQIQLRKKGDLDEKIFAEQRLRRGVYGQRYDIGQRHDGIRTQQIDFPCGDLTKGPDTVFDAPGMLRIKIPTGRTTADQMDVLADLAEEYSVGVLHVTTRQDYQMHYTHIDDMPSIMRRLAAVGVTTREACGNSVRNVTACPFAGICRDEAFDVTPYSNALAQFMLGHPDAQDFGRKFKPAFSGCADHACGLANMHDIGYIAVEREVDGERRRGFEVYVGGGLGAVPHDAQLFDDFVSPEEILPLTQSVARVFARLGEKKNRARARIKFLVAKMGIDAFRKEVRKEREILPHDPRWTSYLDRIEKDEETPPGKSSPARAADAGDAYEVWSKTNVYPQRQPGYAALRVTLPLGDLTSRQMRTLAEMARRYCGGAVRASVDQNLLFRWVGNEDIAAFYSELEAIGLAEPGAGTIVDVTSCPGTDTCKLGISASRGLAAELRRRLAAQQYHLDEVVGGLHIKISGCFNSCGQHHIADLGFYGVNRNVRGRSVPHFQVILGGKWKDNGGSYGLAVGAVPSKNIPDAVALVIERYTSERQGAESFQDFTARIGRRALKALFTDLTAVPEYDEDPAFYSDWGDPREFTHGDRTKGECAGELVSLVDFNLAGAEREAFEAQILLEEDRFNDADKMAYQSMLSAAKALVKTQFLDVPDDPDEIVENFRRRFYDTELFFDQYAKGKFANYLLRRHSEGNGKSTKDSAHRLIEEAQLFIEAAHACETRMQQTIAANPA